MQMQALDDPSDQYETLKHPCNQIVSVVLKLVVHINDTSSIE
jgi:hypothetical protein